MTTAADDRAMPVVHAGVEYASWGQRLVAWLIDLAILAGVGAAVTYAAAFAAGKTAGDFLYAFNLIWWVFMPMYFAYFTVLNGRGQTVGKRLLGITVVDRETGAPIGIGRGAGREAIRVVCMLFFYVPLIIDGLRPLWNERNQTWHDSAAQSIVVRAPPN